MEYPDSVRFLYALGNEIKTAKLGLERIEALLAALGNPHRESARYIHVAGTNGKGSTCAMIESGLRAAGYRTGLFTSPHLIEPTERIRIDGQPVPAADFARAFEIVHRAAEALIASGAIEQHPSYFETVTAMAFVLFQELRVEVVALEVGLGGRLDATNVVHPALCVITPVDFDHEQFLGKTLASIAGEKAGILKRGVPAVVAPQRNEADEVIRDRAAELGCELIAVPDARGTANRYGSHVAVAGLEIDCPLRGQHQIVNAATAGIALQKFGIANAAIAQGIRHTHWPGRLDQVSDKPETIVDGAHNPSGARAFAAYVAEFYRADEPTLIFGAMRDKAVGEMAEVLFPLFRQVIVTAPQQGRALAPASFLQLTDHPRVSTAPNLSAAWQQASSLGRPVFISGSLYLVGEAMKLLRPAYTDSPLTRSA